MIDSNLSRELKFLIALLSLCSCRVFSTEFLDDLEYKAKYARKANYFEEDTNKKTGP